MEEVKKKIMESMQAAVNQTESDMQMILQNITPMLKAAVMRSLNAYLPLIEESLTEWAEHFEKSVKENTKKGGVKSETKAV